MLTHEGKDVGEAPAEPAAFHLERTRGDAGETLIRLRGRLDLADSDALWTEMRAAASDSASISERPRVRVDLSGIEHADGASASILMAVRAEVLTRGGAFAWQKPNKEVAHLLDLYGCPSESPSLRAAPERESALAQVGQATLAFWLLMRRAFRFIGEFSRSLAAAFRAPRSVNWSSVGGLMERAGSDGVPIVLLINFLVGFIMGLQAAEQLRRFGANVFVANLVGLSLTRELAPLMTAIIVAGRSGAAYAAELGTMKVSEEIDALRTLGLDPQRFLVFPRVLALTVVVPILTLLADIVGILGGWFVAVTMLDLTSIAYVTQLRGALDVGDVMSGIIKSGVFAATITLISCQRGLETRGGAAGVGASTTSAVVSILFALVLLDAGFTFLFELIGL